MIPSIGDRRGKWALALHGGAGEISPQALSEDQQKAYRDALGLIASTGAALLDGGGGAIDAVESVVRALEDNPLFNAGRGAVLNAQGRVEMDASIMNGRDRRAGAAAGLTAARNPVSAARAVMERSGHVMVAGPGADAFVTSEGLGVEEPDYFFSEVRWRSLEAFLLARGDRVPDRPAKLSPALAADPLVHDEGKQGTVGAVAVDRFGHVAAATSTGGITGKRWGRVGDSPIIGAGCYASDTSCAVSCTGSGEHFIRLVLAHRIASKVEFGGLKLESAMRSVIGDDLSAIGGSGGAIAVSPLGDLACSFNTAGMYRAFARADGRIEVKIFADDLEAADLDRRP